MPEIIRARHIAAYWPADGEISPLPLMDACMRKGKTVYLPRVLGSGQLVFRIFSGHRALKANRYGIPEPVSRFCHSAKKPDIVLMPLVAFDKKGNRLGMGGGYYDKTFAFKRQSLWRKKPLLIGLAHDFQEVAGLHRDDWDIPLSAIVTNTRVIRIR